jgi:hypothetical protein
MRVIDNQGVSEVIGLVVIVMIATTSIGIVVFWGVPMMESRKVFVRVDSTLKQFEDLNDVIKKVSSRGVNTSEKFDFVTDAGQISVGDDNERFVLYYSINSDFEFSVSGFDKGEDDAEFTIDISDGEPDNPVLAIYHLDDPDLDETGIVINPPVPVQVTNPIKGAVRIDIYDIINENDVYGRIWLFDTKSISYELSVAEGIYKVIAENGAVVHISPYSNRLYDTPNLHYKNNSDLPQDSVLVMHINTIKSKGYISGSGMGRYNFIIKSNRSLVQENRITIPDTFNIMIYGRQNVVDAWVDYYKSQGFSLDDNVLSIEDKGGSLIFSLIYSVSDVVRVI